MLSGVVVDQERRPLEGVEVRVIGDSVRAFTSRAGTFRLYAPRGEEILFQLRRPGFNAQLLRTKGDWSGTIVMMAGAFVLPEVQITARYAKPAEYAGTAKYDDFFRRRRQGFGEFILREELDRRRSLHTVEIFEGRAGIKVSMQQDRGLSAVAFARCNEYPPKINVYVDGRKLLPHGAISVARTESPVLGARRPREPETAGIVGEMLSRVDPSEIELIEIFRGPGELPPEFNDGNCGAISIWTRQGAR
jgi:hypothetical protein